MSLGKSSIVALAEFADRMYKDLQKEADKVTSLEFKTNDAKEHRLFEGIKFSNLKIFSLHGADHQDRMPLRPYIQPKLEQLSLLGGSASDRLLKELFIDHPGSISEQGFIRFLRGSRSLKKLVAVHRMKRFICYSVFSTICGMTELQALELATPISAGFVATLLRYWFQFGMARTFFPKLHKLDCTAESSALAELSPYLDHLTELNAGIEHSSASSAEVEDCIIQNLAEPARCPNLRILVLYYLVEEVVYIQPQVLINLVQRHPQLTALYICGNIAAEGFEDPHLISMMQALPQLKELQLEFDGHLTAIALAEAAKVCGAKLVEFDVRASFDLQNRTGINVSFSQLESLVIGKLVPSSNSADAMATEAIDTAKFLAELAPAVLVEAKSTNPFTDMVIENMKR
ncbi:hypothetical protein F5Y04DRAFT_255968 [Hypomontagnella monticulosa]|nr:hypothetical protein F5Y04DRAFT_255968 [Hypomontagnella monticulosa]